MNLLADQIDAILPQTQCRRCGYPDCRAYADAIATDEADINQCPPGGDETIRALTGLLGREPKALNPANGIARTDVVAFIEESVCIGCTKCIQACPVDAIVGAAKKMHTVIEALCTGCELCIPPCPVDCIQMQSARGTTQGIKVPVDARLRADFFRAGYHSRNTRLAGEKTERKERLQQKTSRNVEIIAQRKAEIAAAVARVQAKRAQRARESNKHES
ncbi:MAG: RnfABCDGE type electron transport complex subunit B [Gammaproteobacteria bacterium]